MDTPPSNQLSDFNIAELLADEYLASSHKLQDYGSYLNKNIG